MPIDTTSNVSIQDVRNWLSSPLYSTYQLASGTPPATISFFNVNSPAIELSNVKTANRLVNGEFFQCRAMRFVCVGMALADINLFTKSYTAVLAVGGKDQLVAPIDFWSGGAGPSGAVATTATTTTIQNWNNGVPDPRAVASFDQPIEINAQQDFTVELRNTGGGLSAVSAAVFIRCYLDGTYGRNVG